MQFCHNKVRIERITPGLDWPSTNRNGAVAAGRTAWGACGRENEKSTFIDPFNMPLPSDLSLIAVATFALIGTILAAVLLGIAYFAPRWLARATIVAASGLAMAGIAAGLWLRTMETAVPLVLLAIGTAMSLVVGTKLSQHAVILAMRPRVVMSALLILSLGAAVYVNWVATQPVDDSDQPLIVGSYFHPIEGLVALTDLGQALPLIAYDDEEAIGDAERRYLDSEKFRHQVISLAAPKAACNCHGWIYAGGRFAIQSRYIDNLLADNGYVEVARPQASDLVIYRGSGETIEHTGLVRMIGDDGLILVESKWGPLGVYLYPVDSQPYGNSRKFYRSPRAGHLVAIVPDSGLPAAKLPAWATLPDNLDGDMDASLAARRIKLQGDKIYDRPVLRVPGQRRS